MKALVLNLLSYNFVNKDSGEVVQGVNLNYISPEVFYDNIDLIGMQNSKVKISEDFINKNKLKEKEFPFVCDLQFEARPLPNGKSQVVLSAISNIKKVNIFD